VFFPLRATTTATDHTARCASSLKTQLRASEIARRRTKEKRVEALSDDDGGGLSMFAPPVCRRRWRNNAFPFRQLRRRRRQPSEHRRERQRAIKHSATPEQLENTAASVGNRAPSHRGEASREAFIPLRARRRRNCNGAHASGSRNAPISTYQKGQSSL
jgi:hypothetical protein